MSGREGENSDKEVGSFVDGDFNFVCDNLYFYRFKEHQRKVHGRQIV